MNPLKHQKLRIIQSEDDFAAAPLLQPLSFADASTPVHLGSCPGIVSGTTWSIGQRRPRDSRVERALQDFRQNTSFASKEHPDMGTEFGCKIFMLCADSLHPRKA